MMLNVLAFYLLACGLSLADDTTDRLARVEALLAEVQGRNEALERENVAIKHAISILEQRVTYLEESGSIEEHGIKETVGLTEAKPGDEELQKSSKTSRFVSDYQGSAVAFTAVVSPPQLTNLGSGQIVKYDTVITNVGGAYHNTTGVFTAPLSGVYVFNFAVMMDPGLAEYLQLVKNGEHVMWNYGHAPGATHLISASRTATVELTAGDEVWIRTQASTVHGNGIIHGNGFTTFSGWIIAMFE